MSFQQHICLYKVSSYSRRGRYYLPEMYNAISRYVYHRTAEQHIGCSLRLFTNLCKQRRMTNDSRSDGGQMISAPTCTNVTYFCRERFAVTKIRDFDGFSLGVVTQIRDLDNTPTTYVSFRQPTRGRIIFVPYTNNAYALIIYTKK